MSVDADLPPVLQSFAGSLVVAMRLAEARAPRRRRPRGALAATLSAATAAGAVLAFFLATNGPQTTSSAAAAPLLRAAAAAALKAPSILPRDDEYLYVRTVGRIPTGMSTRQGVSVTAVEKVVTDRWFSVRRGSLERTQILSLAFGSARDARLWRENGGQQRGTVHISRGPQNGPWYVYFGGARATSGELSRARVIALPGDPRRLLELTLGDRPQTRAWLGSLPGLTGGHPSTRTTYAYTYSSITDGEARPIHAAPNGFAFALEAFSDIEQDFVQVTLPARVRSGLYRALAVIPGVRYAGMQRDLAGRVGAEIAFDDLAHDIRYELIFDPATSALLGERQVTTHRNDGFPAGTSLEDVAFLNEAVTSMPRVPNAAPGVR